jgi:hypothetical protein
MLVRVPTVRITFKVQDFINSLIKSWYQLYNILPNKSQIAVLYAQWGLETGLGTFCWNNNIGNMKAADVPGVRVEYCALNGVWEIVNGKRIVLSPENPGAWFRSFPTLDVGVIAHINLLRNQRYKASWIAVEQGDPAKFAHLLKQQGYYTAPEADYIKAMQYYFTRFMNDNMFENIISNFAGVDFPPDYKPVNISVFNVIDDTVEKPTNTIITVPASVNRFSSVLDKIKNIFKDK